MLNGKPYHSADNGFACAAAGRGIREALREHLNVIVRDKDLEIAFSNDRFQNEIELLVADKEALEEQKRNRQNDIKEATEELEAKDVELAELRVKLEAPIQSLENAEGSRIEEFKEKLEQKASVLESKKVEKARIKTDLESPTQVELNSLDVQRAAQGFHPLIFINSIFAVLATVAVIALFGYLYLFYVSAGEKVVKSSDELNLERLIDYEALGRSLKSDDRNWLVLVFPSIFIALAFFTHFTFEHRKWVIFGILLLATIVIEGMIGWKIAGQIVTAQEQAESEKIDSFWFLLLLFGLLGLGVSLLLGFGLQCISGFWENIRPRQNESKQIEMQIKAEKNDRQLKLSDLNTEILHLEEGINQLSEEKKAYSESIKTAYRHPIESQIAVLEIEIKQRQEKIQLLNEQVDSLQMEIDRCESEVDKQRNGQRDRILDLKRMEAQAKEFVNGWCRYIAQSVTELPDDHSGEIREIQALADQTIQEFKATLKTV